MSVLENQNHITQEPFPPRETYYHDRPKFRIKIDKEFQSLIPALMDDEFEQLKQNIITEGCRDALVLWNNTLIDGHNRYKICTENNIPFQIITKEFDSREDVIYWIITNQFGRRNLIPFQRSELALRLKPIIEAKAKERQGTRSDLNIVQKSALSESTKSRDELAKLAGVSHDTIHKVEIIKEKASPEQLSRARTGGKGNSVHAIYTEIKKKEEPEKYEKKEALKVGEEVNGVSTKVDKLDKSTESEVIETKPTTHTNPDTKICCECGNELPKSEFYEDLDQCKKCYKKNMVHPQKIFLENSLYLIKQHRN